MSRRGFTVIELVVVMAVIGLLCALLTPAIMSARGAARKMTCSSHLRQLGLAASNYSSTHNCMPPGAINNYSWLVMLLPYVDQENLYREFTFAPDESNLFQPGSQHPVWKAKIAVFKCPTDPLTASGTVEGPVHSYLGCTGSGLLQGGYNGLIRNTYEGCVFESFPSGLVRLGDVPNGLSNVVMASERLIGDESGHLLRNNWTMTTPSESASDIESFRAACLAETPRAMAGGGWYGDPSAGHFWWDGSILNTLYNHMMTPNERSCHSNGPEFGSYTASSLHTGGVNVVYGDGHVAFVSQNVDSVVWAKMGSRVDRDISPCPEF